MSDSVFTGSSNPDAWKEVIEALDMYYMCYPDPLTCPKSGVPMEPKNIDGELIDASHAGSWYDNGELVALLERKPGFLARLADWSAKFAQSTPVAQAEGAVAQLSAPEQNILDPRTREPLEKRAIKNINIDYNRKTGGVFLDKGELKSLSEVADIVAELKNILPEIPRLGECGLSDLPGLADCSVMPKKAPMAAKEKLVVVVDGTKDIHKQLDDALQQLIADTGTTKHALFYVQISETEKTKWDDRWKILKGAFDNLAVSLHTTLRHQVPKSEPIGSSETSQETATKTTPTAGSTLPPHVEAAVAKLTGIDISVAERTALLADPEIYEAYTKAL